MYLHISFRNIVYLAKLMLSVFQYRDKKGHDCHGSSHMNICLRPRSRHYHTRNLLRKGTFSLQPLQLSNGNFCELYRTKYLSTGISFFIKAVKFKSLEIKFFTKQWSDLQLFFWFRRTPTARPTTGKVCPLKIF